MRETSLLWWEFAAGLAASVISMHMLIAAAAGASTTELDASRLATAYLPLSALTTLCDSLVDAERDAATRSHAYIAYYATLADGLRRIGAVAQEASSAACRLPDAPFHITMVAGVAGFYLSAPQLERAMVEAVRAELPPQLLGVFRPVFMMFRGWRGAKLLKELLYGCPMPVG
jgi:hypothetical protein